MEKKLTNSGPFIQSTRKHSIYTLIFPILLLAAKSSEAMIYLSMTRLILCRLAAA
jgi:hypothetical protein